MMKVANIGVIFTTISLIVSPLISGAQTEFNYNQIISDRELNSYQTMTAAQIQSFLEKKGSYLSNYFFDADESGIKISAAQHIFNASQAFQVNPKFLLVMLQKEQSLVEQKTPKVTQLDWAMGYGCFDGQPCFERWRGFHKQVNSAAEQFRYYYDNINEYNFQPGKNAVIDGKSVTPTNAVTAALYNYTPHLHGNKLFRDIWDRYFITRLPDGTLAKADGDPGVWLLKNGIKRAFISELALVSRYNPELIITVSESDLDQYARGFDIEFAAYSILRGAQSGDIYLLTIDNKRLIASMEVFRNLGFNPEEIEDVDDLQLDDIPSGAPITFGDAFPTGAVLRDELNGKLYYVEAGRKYPVVDEALAALNYPQFAISSTAHETLLKYTTGFPVKARDSLLLKGSGPEVYVISNGKRRHIATEQAFNTIGYTWTNILVVSDDIVLLHALGDPISIE